ncbi:hypothetical protein HNR12_003015 [Streptomonospora nanhaiensis]|uniref:Uncharacterized protein n=1 Tax=Streptomonospora nanhaiensis TaxID=1323731 RepID=A0A853BMN6_9ACTN|nr:hypothetical protein [Streptomonospora nanhaiensis]NYI96738.1 hypothetical protein [Streptomonospora nanhaiensis]
MAKSTEELAKRIVSFDWSEPGVNMEAQADRMVEYLRRAALWSEVLDAPWPFFDYALAVDSGVRAPEGLVQEVENSLPPHLHLMVRYTCVWALHFRELRAHSGPVLPALPDPFVPLLEMYQQGDSWQVNGAGFIEVGIIGIPRNSREKYVSDTPFPPIK